MKQKTKQAAFNRFKITKTGKVVYRHQNARHLKSTKSKNQMRRQAEPGKLTGKFSVMIKRMLPYG